MSYKDTSYYKKIPRKMKDLIDSYNNNKLSKLILIKLLKLHIKDDLKTMNTKYVRSSELKGLLMKHFNFTYKEVEPILPTKEDTKEYNKIKAGALMSKLEMNINENLLKELIKIPELYLMVASGRRYNELKEISYKDDIFYCCLSKTRETNSNEIYIIGDRNIFKQKLKESPIRDIGFINKKIKTILERFGFDISINSKIKKSTHLMRSIYINIISRYYNYNNSSLPAIAKKYLHKKGFSSVINYIYIKFARNFSLPEILKSNDIKIARQRRGRTNKEIKLILMDRGFNSSNVKGFNKLNKSKLLKLLNESDKQKY